MGGNCASTEDDKIEMAARYQEERMFANVVQNREMRFYSCEASFMRE